MHDPRSQTTLGGGTLVCARVARSARELTGTQNGFLMRARGVRR